MKELKTVEEKLKESIHLLTQIREAGIAATDPGYTELSKRFSEWVKGTEPWTGTVDFLRFNRRAKVYLPQQKKHYAGIEFLHHVF